MSCRLVRSWRVGCSLNDAFSGTFFWGVNSNFSSNTGGWSVSPTLAGQKSPVRWKIPFAAKRPTDVVDPCRLTCYDSLSRTPSDHQVSVGVALAFDIGALALKIIAHGLRLRKQCEQFCEYAVNLTKRCGFEVTRPSSEELSLASDHLGSLCLFCQGILRSGCREPPRPPAKFARPLCDRPASSAT